jgi:hypothetical protein
MKQMEKKLAGKKKDKGPNYRLIYLGIINSITAGFYYVVNLLCCE